jgi:nitrite reductase (NADH) small subunit
MSKEKKYITEFDSLVPLVGREVKYGEEGIAVFLLTNGTVKAIQSTCPHKEGPLAEGTVSGEYVFCPLHDYKISLVDGKVQEPDTGCVKVYETLVEDGKVYLLL